MGVINLTTHAGVYDDCIGCTDCRMLYSVADMRESMTIVDFIPIVPPVGSVAPWLGSPRGWGRPVAGVAPWLGSPRGWGRPVAGVAPWQLAGSNWREATDSD
jgi:hypothetical protein